MTYSFLSLFDIILLTLSIISYYELPKSHDVISRHFDKIIISYHDISTKSLIYDIIRTISICVSPDLIEC
jgi:hypothetical protein